MATEGEARRAGACGTVNSRGAAPAVRPTQRLAYIAMTWLATLFVACVTIWCAFALWYQAPGGALLRCLFVAAWTAVGLGTLLALNRGHLPVALTIFVLAFAGVLGWWQTLKPSNNRVWADDVSRLTSGTVVGDTVTLQNVREFDWRSDTDYTAAWSMRTYDLSHLKSVDMITSYWSSHAIAHVLFSFGFDTGAHVVFSVEIRREKTEEFSEIGGFFKEFELSIIAADERDVIRVRTNVRGEDDYLYHINMPLHDMRSLFLAYVAQANELTRTPRYYNTITVNCTTLVYDMMRHIVGHLPLSYRLLLSGYLPEYVYSVGGLDMRYPLEQLRAVGRITARARRSGNSPTFSSDIRAGIPELPATG